MPPQKVLSQMPYSSPMKIADLGCGTGEYSLVLARMLEPEGHVYAVDVQALLLESVARYAKQQGLEEMISVIHADIESEKLPFFPDALDSVLVVHTLFQINHKHKFFEEIARVLRPGGTLLVVDWISDFAGVGPNRDMLVSDKEVVRLASSYNLEESERLAMGQYEYGIVFRKRAS